MSKSTIHRLKTFSSTLCVCTLVTIIAVGSAFSANYSRVNEPTVPPAFIPLPPGEIHPEGWLLDWCNAARDGITGHADSIHFIEKDCSRARTLDLGETFRVGWTGKPYTGFKGNEWALEQAGYWFDGAIRMGFILQDSSLLKKIRPRLDTIVMHATAARSFAWWAQDTAWAYFWPCAVLGRALVAYYEGTRDPAVLKALETVYSAFPSTTTAIDRNESNLESMFEAYSFGASNTLLTKALAMLKANESTINSWANNSINAIHGVSWNERSKMPAIGYPWANNISYLNASVNCYNWAETNHVLPFGVVSSQESLAGIGAFKSTETCNITDYSLSVLWLLRMAGSGKYGDWLERALFNASALSLSRDFKQNVYFQSPNRTDTLNPPNASPNSNAGSQPQFYLPAHFPGCCTGNLNRVLPNYVMHMWMATYDNGLAATMYGPCKVSARAGDNIPVVITCTTNYPFDESLHFTVAPSSSAAFPLYFRIPGWCKNARITVNGVVSSVTPDQKGFVKISRTWTSGDAIDILFPMQPRIAKYGSSGNAPSLSVYRGPLLFALPIGEKGYNLPDPATNYNYALDFNSNDSVVVNKTAMPQQWAWQADAPITLSVPAISANWGPGSIPNNFSSGSSKATIKLVPYACAKFRVSMFPTTQQAFNMPEYLPVKGGLTSVSGNRVNRGGSGVPVFILRTVNGNLYIHGSTVSAIAIVNAQGRTVYSERLQASLQKWTIDLKNKLSTNGAYFVLIYSGGKMIHQQRMMVCL